MIMGLGLVAFVLDSMVGVLFVKVLNIFTPKNKINPMVGAAGISAFPMSSGSSRSWVRRPTPRTTC